MTPAEKIKPFPIARPTNIEGETVARSTGDKTTVPNYLIVIIVGILIALLGFVYDVVKDKIERLETRLAVQETYMQNTREKLIANGWTVDAKGDIHPPEKKGK